MFLVLLIFGIIGFTYMQGAYKKEEDLYYDINLFVVISTTVKDGLINGNGMDDNLKPNNYDKPN